MIEDQGLSLNSNDLGYKEHGMGLGNSIASCTTGRFFTNLKIHWKMFRDQVEDPVSEQDES